MSKIFSRLSSVFKRRYDARLGTLERAGVVFANDGALVSRIDTLENEINKLLSDTGMTASKKIDILDNIIDRVASPWGRGGDNPNFFKAHIAWKRLVSMYKAYKVMDTSQTDENRKISLMMTDVWAEQQVIPFGWILISAAYRDKDISPQIPITIQSSLMWPQRNVERGYGPNLGSEARHSEEER